MRLLSRINIKMPSQRFKIVSPLLLQSNLVKLRIGADSSVPREVRAWEKRVSGEGIDQFAIALNTYYPEVFGGYYENRALLRVVSEAFRNVKCHCVLAALLSDGDLCPDELTGVLVDREEYFIVRGQQRIGALLMWSLDAGGGSEFVRDAIVLSCIGSLALAELVFSELEGRCKELGIRTVHY